MIDLEALKARLAEYDPNAPKCPQRVSRHSNYAPDHISSSDSTYHDYDMVTHSPCCRPEGHEGECRNSRSVMGWPGFATISSLLAEIERLRNHRELCAENLLRGYETGKSEERAAVVAWLREQASSTTADVLRARDLYAVDIIERGEHRREEKP